ncbi:MAG: hypothetical protein DDT39_01578 [Firmicutes bacterium]|nr:hypothetical protein [candidate division NPL-UPA2 bacterium]
MINREMYMSRIRPFIGKELIKVLTGIRRSGKSVMLELITAQALHDEVVKRVANIDAKAYLFFDEIQNEPQWHQT